jgi:NAD(P) transhydrogenase subunit beta
MLIYKDKGEQKPVKSGNAEDAAFLMKNASSVIIVPGYGMAVAQAQHALREMVDKLKKNDVKVSVMPSIQLREECLDI